MHVRLSILRKNSPCTALFGSAHLLILRKNYPCTFIRVALKFKIKSSKLRNLRVCSENLHFFANGGIPLVLLNFTLSNICRGFKRRENVQWDWFFFTDMYPKYLSTLTYLINEQPGLLICFAPPAGFFSCPQWKFFDLHPCLFSPARLLDSKE